MKNHKKRAMSAKNRILGQGVGYAWERY